MRKWNTELKCPPRQKTVPLPNLSSNKKVISPVNREVTTAKVATSSVREATNPVISNVKVATSPVTSSVTSSLSPAVTARVSVRTMP